MSKIQVLFIDDDASLQTLATAMLNAGIFDVISAGLTKEAEKILASRRVDIIVCDVMMPEEDGIRFCRRLRDRGDRTPLLFLSAIGDPRTIQQGLDAGASDYLVKPFDVHALQKKLLSMLGKSPSSPKTQAQEPKSQCFLGWLRR